MKKILSVILISIILLSGCSANTYLSYRYATNTGYKVVVRLETTDGYKMHNDDGTFTVVDSDKNDMISAMIINSEGVSIYTSGANSCNPEFGEMNGNQYLHWIFEGEDHTEYNYLVTLEGGKLGILLSSLDEDLGRKAFEKLTFVTE